MGNEVHVAIPGVKVSVSFEVLMVVGVKPLGGYEVFLLPGSGLISPSVFVLWTSCRSF